MKANISTSTEAKLSNSTPAKTQDWILITRYVIARQVEGGGGLDMIVLICGIQSLDVGGALVIAQHLNKFKRLRRLGLVSYC